MTTVHLSQTTTGSGEVVSGFLLFSLTFSDGGRPPLNFQRDRSKIREENKEK